MVRERPEVTISTCSSITAFSGYVGNFELTITCRPEGIAEFSPGAFVPDSGVFVPPPRAGKARPVKTGAVILATGFSLYTPRTGEYGWEELPEVI